MLVGGIRRRGADFDLFAERSEAQTLYTWADQGTDWGTADELVARRPADEHRHGPLPDGGYSYQPITLAASYSAGSLWVTRRGVAAPSAPTATP